MPKIIFTCTVKIAAVEPGEASWYKTIAETFGVKQLSKAPRDPKTNEIKLNSLGFSEKLKPGFCFGMTIDWAKASLTHGGVRYKSLLNPAVWPLIQSSYEINKVQGMPDEIRTITANGLQVISGGGKGAEIAFNKDFTQLAQQLVNKTGTHIIILFGAPGAGAHFMGFRRTEEQNRFVSAEFFDPNDALVSYSSEQEFIQDVSGLLNYNYNGQHPGYPVLNDYCGWAHVQLPR